MGCANACMDKKQNKKMVVWDNQETPGAPLMKEQQNISLSYSNSALNNQNKGLLVDENEYQYEIMKDSKNSIKIVSQSTHKDPINSSRIRNTLQRTHDTQNPQNILRDSNTERVNQQERSIPSTLDPNPIQRYKVESRDKYSSIAYPGLSYVQIPNQNKLQDINEVSQRFELSNYSTANNNNCLGNHLSISSPQLLQKEASIPVFGNPSVMVLMEQSMMYQHDSDIKFNPKMQFRL